VLIVDNTYRTPVRSGVLLVGKLREGNVRPGEKLEAKLLDGGRLEVVVQAIDSMTEGDRGERTVGLLLEPTDTSKLTPGTVLTSPQDHREIPVIEEFWPAESEVVRLSLVLSSGGLRALVLTGLAFAVAMFFATFMLAAYYVVTDQNARIPVLVALIVGILVAPSILIGRFIGTKKLPTSTKAQVTHEARTAHRSQ
jgi:hypothetical protein